MFKTAATVATLTSATAMSVVTLASADPTARPAATAGVQALAADVPSRRDLQVRRASRSRAGAGKAESLRLRQGALRSAATDRAALARAVRQRALRLRAAAAASSAPVSTAPSSISTASFSAMELRIRSCESGPDGAATDGRAHDYDYTAENPSSTASGAWQFLDSTWHGYGGYTRASSAPRAVQDSKARSFIDANGVSAWESSRSCWSA